MPTHRSKHKKSQPQLDEMYDKPAPGDAIEQRFKVGDRVTLLRKGPNYGRSFVVRHISDPQRKHSDRNKPKGSRTFVAYYSLHGLNHGVTDDELASASSFISRLKQWFGGRNVRKKHTWVYGKGYIYGDPNT